MLVELGSLPVWSAIIFCNNTLLLGGGNFSNCPIISDSSSCAISRFFILVIYTKKSVALAGMHDMDGVLLSTLDRPTVG